MDWSDIDLTPLDEYMVLQERYPMFDKLIETFDLDFVLNHMVII